MTWFFAIVIVAAMGAVAVVAGGRGGSMAEVYDDRPDARVPADGPLTPADLSRVRFSTAFRGYRMSEVDTLLDRIAAELAEARLGAGGQAGGQDGSHDGGHDGGGGGGHGGPGGSHAAPGVSA